MVPQAILSYSNPAHSEIGSSSSTKLLHRPSWNKAVHEEKTPLLVVLFWTHTVKKWLHFFMSISRGDGQRPPGG